jgi:hypothetical protein
MTVLPRHVPDQVPDQEKVPTGIYQMLPRPGQPDRASLGSGLIQTQNAMMAARTTADKKLIASLS